MLAESSFKNVTPEDLQMVNSNSGSFDPEVDEKVVLAKWKQKALSSRAVKKKTANGFSRQNRESDKALQQIIMLSTEITLFPRGIYVKCQAFARQRTGRCYMT